MWSHSIASIFLNYYQCLCSIVMSECSINTTNLGVSNVWHWSIVSDMCRSCPLSEIDMIPTQMATFNHYIFLWVSTCQWRCQYQMSCLHQCFTVSGIRVCVLIHSLRLSVKFNLKENVSHTFHTHTYKNKQFLLFKHRIKEKKAMYQTWNENNGTIKGNKSSKTMKESPKMNFLLQTSMRFTHILKLNHPTRQIHTHPFVPATQNPTQTHFNSSKRVFDSTWKIKFWRRNMKVKIVSEWVSERVLTGDGEEEPFSCKIRECPINSWLPLLRWRMRNCWNGFERDSFRVFKFQMLWSQNPII